MDKNIVVIVVCGIIIFIVFLMLDNNKCTRPKRNKSSSEEDEHMDIELFENNLESPKPAFDPYTFYTSMKKSDDKIKYTKDNFDFDYETDFKYKNDFIENFSDNNLDAQGTNYLSNLEKTSTYLNSSPVDNNLLVTNELESNSIFSLPFPENTSLELNNFTAENVTNKYDADNMEDLYNTINADVYRGYKTLKYML